MLFIRIRPVLLVVACALLCGPGRSQDETPPTAPPPRPVKNKAPAPEAKIPPKPGAADRESLRKDVEALLAGQSPEQAGAALELLAREWDSRKGAFEVAQQRFAAQAAELQKARQRLDDHKLPAAVPPIARAADIPPALKAAQELADAHAERVKHSEAVKDALAAVAKAGDDLTAAAGAADDQLFKLRTAAGLVKDVPADKLPPAFLPAALGAATAKLKAATAEAGPAVAGARSELPAREKELADAKAASAAAAAKLDALKAAQAELSAAFAYEDQLKAMGAAPLADEFDRLRREVAGRSKALAGDEADYKKAVAPVEGARAKLLAVRDPLTPADGVTGHSLDAAQQRLAAAQQYLAARVRAFDERAEKAKALVAALEEQEQRAVAYSDTLNRLRATSGQLAAVAAEVERRVGRGDLDAAKAPDGLAEAVGLSAARAKLEADAAALRAARAQLRAERDKLRAPDVEVDSAKALTAGLLANVAERIGLHADLKTLAADYATARAARSEAEQKRLGQKAADRMARENAQWDVALALDRSKSSTDIGALLSAYYSELVELEEKEDNLRRRKEALEKLVRLTEREAEEAAKLRSTLDKYVSPLPPPGPRGERPPVAQFDAWLAARLSPNGLKAEADTYHDEVVRLTAVGHADARRALALTGDIGAARGELLEARARGLITLAVKIGLVLLAALVLPRLLTRVLRRSVRGGTGPDDGPSPVLRPVRAALRVVVWLAALAVVLSILGFDVTAFVVAVAVGVLAVALAARPAIADMLGSVAVSAERRFKVGDVIRLGGGEPARVVGMTWRSISLKNTNGVVSSVPNRAVADSVVENHTRGTETYDTLTVTISTDKDAGKVINVIRAAMTQCKNLTADQGVTVVSYVQKGTTKLVQYRFWWFLKDYELRNKTRDEVFARVAVGLAHEDMTGIEIALA